MMLVPTREERNDFARALVKISRALLTQSASYVDVICRVNCRFSRSFISAEKIKVLAIGQSKVLFDL